MDRIFIEHVSIALFDALLAHAEGHTRQYNDSRFNMYWLPSHSVHNLDALKDHLFGKAERRATKAVLTSSVLHHLKRHIPFEPMIITSSDMNAQRLSSQAVERVGMATSEGITVLYSSSIDLNANVTVNASRLLGRVDNGSVNHPLPFPDGA